MEHAGKKPVNQADACFSEAHVTKVTRQSHFVTAAEPRLRAALEVKEHGQDLAVLNVTFHR